MISQTAEYALRAVVCLARSAPERRWTVRDIHEQTDVPEGYLSKVMQLLARAKIVRSQRGRTGGFRLERPVRPGVGEEIREGRLGERALDALEFPVHPPVQRAEFLPMFGQAQWALADPL